MRKLLIIIFCAVGLTAAAQNFPWSGTINMATAGDTTIEWADHFRSNQPWSLDIEFTTLDTTTARFGIIVSNFTDGAWNYYPDTTMGFPFRLNNTTLAYIDANGNNRATSTFTQVNLIWQRFGIILIRNDVTSGIFEYRFKQ